MRFPSLFRLPRHQQFRIVPRYYDPVKEEIQERTERIKQEMEGRDSESYQTSRITFKRKTKTASFTSMLQLGIAAILCLMILGWLQFGNSMFEYALWVIVPAYLFYRLNKLKKRK